MAKEKTLCYNCSKFKTNCIALRIVLRGTGFFEAAQYGVRQICKGCR